MANENDTEYWKTDLALASQGIDILRKTISEKDKEIKERVETIEQLKKQLVIDAATVELMKAKLAVADAQRTLDKLAK